MTSSNGLTFTHDDQGRLTSETYAPGKAVTYAYDTRGLLSQVTDWLGGTTSFAYDAAGRLTGLTRPNGTTATYQYDAAVRLIQKVESTPGPISTPLASIALTRDALGQITDALRDVPLKPTSTASGSTGYAYDDASQIVGFGYDGLGRLLTDGARTFEYDAAGRLTHYTAGAESPTFTYDAFGRVLTRTDGATTRQFVWDYATGTPSLVTDNSPLISHLIHTPGGVPLYRVATSGARTYYHYDEAGNTMFLTDQGGSVVTSYAYSPTGETQGLGYTADNLLTYAGARGVFQEGSGGLFRYGPSIHDAGRGRCLSCPSAPLATMGERPGLPASSKLTHPGYRDDSDLVPDALHARFDPYKNPPARRYRRVLLQQGRVLLDSDWNALVDAADRLFQSPVDFVGSNPGPVNSPLDFVGKSPGPVSLPGVLLEPVDPPAPPIMAQPRYPGIRSGTLLQQGRAILDSEPIRLRWYWDRSAPRGPGGFHWPTSELRGPNEPTSPAPLTGGPTP